MHANALAIGSVVPAFEGVEVPLQIVAEVTSFPTVTVPGGALIIDLGSLQEYLAWHSLPPQPVTQWWLATAGAGVPPSLTAAVPAGTDITNAAALATAAASDALSAAPRSGRLPLAERPVAGRLDRGGKRGHPGLPDARGSHAAKRRANALHQSGGDVHL